MEAEPSLETILQNLRQQAKYIPILNQYHRQFLNLLRDVDWIASTKLSAPQNYACPAAKWMDRAARNEK
jgi:hypothetical protein